MSESPTSTIVIGGRSYRRFIPYPKPVNDGTVRCMFCGQIDDPKHHDDKHCPFSADWVEPTS